MSTRRSTPGRSRGRGKSAGGQKTRSKVAKAAGLQQPTTWTEDMQPKVVDFPPEYESVLGGATAQESQTQALGGEEVPSVGKAHREQTPDSTKRRSDRGGRSSTKKQRLSPRKAGASVIPGAQLPNGGLRKIPKGTMMELIQVRDLEIARLMEELQDYEEEAMVLTHQIHVDINEKAELEAQVHEMSRSMAALQRVGNSLQLAGASGPRLTYWDDGQIKALWEQLFTKVVEFATTHCGQTADNDYDGLATYRTDPTNTTTGDVGHFGTFDVLMADKAADTSSKIRICQYYVKKITNSYPARLDSFVGEGRVPELIPTTIIMQILTDEVFDKIRFLLRSEPFWDPMLNPNINQDKPVLLDTDTSDDFWLRQELNSANNDEVAFEYNCIRARMVLHLLSHHAGFGTALTNYLNRIGLLIINAIWPFFSYHCLEFGHMGKFHREGTREFIRFEELFTSTARWSKPQRSITGLHDILTSAMQLAILMRTDNTVIYIDHGGWNLPYDKTHMENVAQHTNRFKKADVTDKVWYSDTKDAFAWLVVAPMLKRAGQADGKGYNESRILSRSKVALNYGDPEKQMDRKDKYAY